MLQETAYSQQPLYAKIGCMERETFTSTKLALHVYTDKQCSQPYEDGHSTRHHATKGYEINGYVFPTHVSFRPPFYSCQACNPAEIADTFNKKSGTWYDDDYISSHGSKENGNNNANGNNNNNNNNNNNGNANQGNDDAYLSANDDVTGYNGKNKNKNKNYNNNNNNNKYNHGDDYYNDDGRRDLMQVDQESGKMILGAAPGQLEVCVIRMHQFFCTTCYLSTVCLMRNRNFRPNKIGL